MLEEYLAWMHDKSLPFWLARGTDDVSGFFWERLDLDGAPVASSELRVRTQARQIYVFAHAASLGMMPADDALALAERALARLRQSAWAPDGRPGWVHRLHADGSVADPRRDLYDHAFILHALGWFVRATEDGRSRKWIDETVCFIDTALAAPHGGWAESDRRELPRRQNPHMHSFEAFLALYESIGSPIYLARAAELFGLFRTRFFRDDEGLLREFFGPSWEIGESHGSHQLDPGHMFEWVWLLRRYARASSRPVDDLCAALFSAGTRLGLDQSCGFIADAVDATGRRLVESRRLWPQTEYLKALLVQHEAGRDPNLLQEAENLSHRLLSSYLANCASGTWRDQFNFDGVGMTETVPASTLYHLFAAAAEIARLTGKYTPH
jgi:mannose/cellobiose epimerase-like protein (N-acyl-D-glucosamine 2-epimerase family)